MKHVTISAPSPEASRPPTPIRDAPFPNGLPVPRHMVSPGQDGYRTPTIEDYEYAAKREGTLSGSNIASALASARSSTTSLLLERLQWRERVRHYTFVFFTLTMATGGLANVIHSGMSMLCSLASPEMEPADDCTSAVPFSWPVCYRGDFLPPQYRPLRDQCRDDIVAFLLASGNVKSINTAPNRASLHPGCCGLFWYHSLEYLSIWTPSWSG